MSGNCLLLRKLWLHGDITYWATSLLQGVAESGLLLVVDGMHYALTTILSNLLDMFRNEVQQDPELQSIIKNYEIGIAAHYTNLFGIHKAKDFYQIWVQG